MKRELYFKIGLALISLGIIIYLGYLGIDDLRIATTGDYQKNWQDVKVVMEDDTVKDYRLNKLKVTVADELHEFFVIPIKLSGSETKGLYGESFIKKYELVYDTDVEIASKNAEVTIEYPTNTHLNYLTNTEQSYLELSRDTNDVSFKSLGKGTYTAELLMENGDILQIVFK